MGIEKGEPFAFLKLAGPGLEKPFYLTENYRSKDGGIPTLSCTLGRGDEVDVKLLQDKLISRHHATVSYNFEKGFFEIECLGRNGVVLNGNKLGKGEKVRLPTQQKLEFGKKELYALLPIGVDAIESLKRGRTDDADEPSAKRSKRQKTPADFHRAVLEALEREPTHQLKSIDINTFIKRTYTELVRGMSDMKGHLYRSLRKKELGIVCVSSVVCSMFAKHLIRILRLVWPRMERENCILFENMLAIHQRLFLTSQ
mmetsp:Transcript_36280/g.94348  ORF Transcript_36280/g.94348 Transcript_36280/m.94348 type:complete len:256 (-) Transcript_36280:395-1162(-)